MTNRTADLSGVSFTIGAEAANVINVIVQFEGPAQGVPAGKQCAAVMWLSDLADGQTLATAPDSVAIGTDGTLNTIATNMYLGISETDGDFDLDITETGGADTFFLNVLVGGEVITSSAITFAA